MFNVFMGSIQQFFAHSDSLNRVVEAIACPEINGLILGARCPKSGRIETTLKVSEVYDIPTFCDRFQVVFKAI